MYIKQILHIHVVIVVLTVKTSSDFTSTGFFQFQVISTTQQPETQQNYQQNILETLNNINNQLSKLTHEISKKCHDKHESMPKNHDLQLLEAKFNETKIQLDKLVIDVEKLKTEQMQVFPKNCYEILKRGNSVGGIYAIQPKSEVFTVRCSMDVLGGGWTYVLNRFDGSQDFYLNWDDYEKGFGNLEGEFWLGLQHLYELAGSEDNELLVELVGWDNKKVRAHYGSFRLGSELEGYPIKVLEGYSGDAGDSLTLHLNNKFTTKDRDQDGDGTGSCAVNFHGAWWYYNCYSSQLTGAYIKSTLTSSIDVKGMIWTTSHGYRSLKEARMMIRPQNK